MVKSIMDLLDYYLKTHDEMFSSTKGNPFSGVSKNWQTGDEVAYNTVFGEKSPPIIVLPLYPEIKGFPHRHDYFEVAYVYRGEHSMIADGNTLCLKAGDACVLNVNAVHGFLPFKMYDDIIFVIAMNRKVIQNVYFDLLSLSRHEFFADFFLRSMQKKNTRQNFVVLRSDSDSDYEVYIRQIIKNQIANNVFSQELINILSAALLIEFARQYGKNITEESTRELKDTDITDIVEHIFQNCRTVSIKSLARHFGYNESYLSSFIKKYSGSSFSDILHSARFFKAARLMVESEQSVAEIMEEVGYTNRTWFTQKFFDRFGCKPQEFRKMREKRGILSGAEGVWRPFI